MKKLLSRRITLLTVAAGLLTLGAPALRADQAPTNQPPTKTDAEALRNMTPDERKQYLAEHPELAQRAKEIRELLQRAGVNPKDLKGLTKEERQTKIQAAVKTRIAFLENKQADGETLTAQEKSDLTLPQKRLQHGGKHADSATANGASAVDPSGKLVKPADNQ